MFKKIRKFYKKELYWYEEDYYRKKLRLTDKQEVYIFNERLEYTLFIVSFLFLLVAFVTSFFYENY